MKKFVSILLTLCMVFSVVAVLPSFELEAEAAAYNINGGTQTSATFILDPGHGGADPGACALGRREAPDVLDMALKVGRYIINSGASVSFTRVTDMTQSLAEKVAQETNGNFSYFLSIHRNAGGGTGVETFYSSGSTAGYNLANAVNSRIVSATGWRNRGLKTNSLYVVRNTRCPAALTELGFIDTQADNDTFVNKNDAIARAIAEGLLSMIGKTLGPSDTTKPSISNISISNVSTSGYRVSCTVSDNVGVTSVTFPTWTAANGQDDLIWHQGIISGNTAYYDVKISEHNGEKGVYTTHIYAYDAAGNSTSAGAPNVDLTEDTVDPNITNYSISNVTQFGFDVKCNVSDNVAVTKVQFPTWTEAGGQDDIIWYNPTVSNGVATIHISIKDHGYQTGLYNVHLYAWDFWGNAKCVTMSVTVPTPAYPTDTDYIPVEKVNASQYESSSQVWTTGTFTAQYWGVAVLAQVSGGWQITAIYASGVAKSVGASTSNPLLAVHSGHTAHAAFQSLEVGAIVELYGVGISEAAVVPNAHVKLPYSFTLIDTSPYLLDENYVTPSGNLKTAAEVSAQFKCTVSVYSASGTALASDALCGTGCTVRRLDSTGKVTDSATVVIAGDVNGDGTISSADYLAMRTSITGVSGEFKGAYAEASDMNNDGQFSASDYTVVMLITNGLK